MKSSLEWQGQNKALSERRRSKDIGVLVFFSTIEDEWEPWSLTQTVLYWTGGLDPLEKGDPLVLPASGVSQLTKSIQKAACPQLMRNKHLVPHQPSSMLLFAKPHRMTALIRRLPVSSKIYTLQIQDQLRPTTVEGPQNRLGLTWGKIARELINYSQHIGSGRR